MSNNAVLVDNHWATPEPAEVKERPLHLVSLLLLPREQVVDFPLLALSHDLIREYFAQSLRVARVERPLELERKSGAKP